MAKIAEGRLGLDLANSSKLDLNHEILFEQIKKIQKMDSKAA